MRQQTADVETIQDALRPVRMFVNTIAGVLNDQSWNHVDGQAFNQPYQYQTAGPTGVAVEGSTVANRGNAGGDAAMSNGTLLLLVGAAVLLVAG